jgi:hypothetical protein
MLDILSRFCYNIIVERGKRAETNLTGNSRLFALDRKEK